MKCGRQFQTDRSRAIKEHIRQADMLFLYGLSNIIMNMDGILKKNKDEIYGKVWYTISVY